MPIREMIHTTERVSGGKRIIQEWLEKEDVCSLRRHTIIETIFSEKTGEPLREVKTTLNFSPDGTNAIQETTRFGLPVVTHGSKVEKQVIDTLSTGKEKNVFEKLLQISLDKPSKQYIGDLDGKYLNIDYVNKYRTKYFNESNYIMSQNGKFRCIQMPGLVLDDYMGRSLSRLSGADKKVVRKFFKEQSSATVKEAPSTAVEIADKAVNSASKWGKAGKLALIGIGICGLLYGVYKLGQHVANKRNQQQAA